ncbi:unnamed protein product [Periconia digitata]|uniref:Uncharacterized protein n=1 Tax=Periconia digitata TaxID=1303443 RepID=A0A9W4UK33_9PLEO|nr:unnamed protein product [Periconia digitata]
MGRKTDRSRNLQLKGLIGSKLGSKQHQTSKKSLSAASKKNYDDAEQLWSSFCSFIQRPAILTFETPIPDTDTLKQFMEWWYAGSEGRIKKSPSLASTEVVWQRIQAIIFRKTNKRVPKVVSEDVYAYIRNELTDEYGIPTDRMRKDACDATVFNDLVTQLHIHDSEEIPHERERLSMHFFLMWCFFSAGRPGAIVPTGYYPNIHLVYEDIQCILMRMGDDTQKFGIVACQRWMKGKKQQVSSNLRLLWLEEPDISCCIVSSLLAFAIADGAFADVQCQKDLNDMKLDSAEDMRVIPYKQSFLQTPFLRDEEGQPISYSRFWYLLRDLSHRAGYKNHIRPYDIRRGTANNIDENAKDTERNQILGQSSKAIYQKYYQHEISMVDIKGLVLRGKQDPGFTTAALRRNLRLQRIPTRLPSRKHREFMQRWRELAAENPNQTDILGKRERTKAWKELLSDWNERRTRDTGSVCTGRTTKISSSIELLGDLDDPETKAGVLGRLDPNRRYIRDEISSGALYSLRSSPSFQCMINLCSDDYRPAGLFYTGEDPITKDTGCTECRFCHKDMDQLHSLQKCLHAHDCAAMARRLSSERPWKPRLCHRCNIWFNTLPQYREHCKAHLEDLDMYCGILRLRHTVISAGRCPFCLGDKKLQNWGEYEKVVTAYLTTTSFETHLRAHTSPLLQELSKVQKCPHPNCALGPQFSSGDLLHHFWDDHGIVVDFWGTKLPRDTAKPIADDMGNDIPKKKTPKRTCSSPEYEGFETIIEGIKVSTEGVRAETSSQSMIGVYSSTSDNNAQPLSKQVPYGIERLEEITSYSEASLEISSNMSSGGLATGSMIDPLLLRIDEDGSNQIECQWFEQIIVDIDAPSGISKCTPGAKTGMHSFLWKPRTNRKKAKRSSDSKSTRDEIASQNEAVRAALGLGGSYAWM